MSPPGCRTRPHFSSFADFVSTFHQDVIAADASWGAAASALIGQLQPFRQEQAMIIRIVLFG